MLLKLLQQREEITLRWKSIWPTTSSLFHLLHVIYVCTQIQLVHRQKQTVSRPYPMYDLSSKSSPWHVSEARETPETPRRSVNALCQTAINILLFSLENYRCVDVKLFPRGKRISCSFWLPRRNVKSKELRRSVCLEIYWANLPNKYTAAACRSNANVNFVFTAKHNVRYKIKRSTTLSVPRVPMARFDCSLVNSVQKWLKTLAKRTLLQRLDQSRQWFTPCGAACTATLVKQACCPAILLDALYARVEEKRMVRTDVSKKMPSNGTSLFGLN